MSRLRVALALAAIGAMVAVFAAGTDRTEACCVFGTPPSITSVTADPGQLWPPNHKMADVILNIVGQPGTGPTTWTVNNVNVVDIAGGAGDPSNDPDFDFSGAAVPWGSPKIIQLRAERSGKGTGRVYSVVVTAQNSYGTASGTVLVTVPHDQGQ